LDGLGRVDRDLVAGLVRRETTSVVGHGSFRVQLRQTYSVSGLESEVVVLDVKVEVGENKLQCMSFGVCAHITAGNPPEPYEPLRESSSR
jgi:hypothetical protein